MGISLTIRDRDFILQERGLPLSRYSTLLASGALHYIFAYDMTSLDIHMRRTIKPQRQSVSCHDATLPLRLEFDALVTIV